MKKLAATFTAVALSCAIGLSSWASLPCSGALAATATQCVGECPAPAFDEIGRCKDACLRSYYLQTVFCNVIPDPIGRALCWAALSDDLAGCINDFYG